MSIVLGCMTFGSQVDRSTAAAMVSLALDSGVSSFDTSNNYNDGRSEEILGSVIGPLRSSVILSTKVGSHVDQSDPSVSGLTAKAILTAVDASLRRLGTDYLDVYYFHRPDWNTLIEESLAAADSLVRSGKVRALGQSNFAAWQVTQQHYLSQQHGWPAPTVCQVMYNLLARRVEAEYEACSRELGLHNIAYNPLAGGLLTGKHHAGTVPTGRFEKAMYRDRYWNDAQFAAVSRLGAIASDAGLTLVELALRWVRDRPLTDAVLVGASSVEQLKTNLAALSGPLLDEATRAACDEVWSALAGAAPAYNR
jgi:aryl-alcohol dehydrogenase-like predicted oxidoreductase